MTTVQSRRFGANFESTFPKPISLHKLPIDQIGDELLGHFMPLGLAPTDIHLIKRNELFDYELKFTLFQGNSEFSLNAQRLRLEFLNAVSFADRNTIVNVITKSQHCVHPPEGTRHAAVLHSHVVFESLEDRSRFFSTRGTRWEQACTEVGVIAYVSPPNWPEQFRVTIEHSLLIQDGAFVHGTTSVAPVEGSIGVAELEAVNQAFENSVAQCGMVFKPLAP